MGLLFYNHSDCKTEIHYEIEPKLTRLVIILYDKTMINYYYDFITFD